MDNKLKKIIQSNLDEHNSKVKEIFEKRTLTSRGIKAGSTMLPFRKGEETPLVSAKGARYVFPTQIPQIDIFLPANSDKTSRGFVAGHWHILTGDKDTFKSAILQRMEIDCLNKGGYVYHLERDNNFSAESFLNGVLGKVNPEASEDIMERFKFYNVNTFSELHSILTSILYTWKSNLYALAKEKGCDPSDLYLPVDLCPVLIVIDSLAGMVSETSIEKELVEGISQTKTAEENTDIHRLIKINSPLMDSLGIPVIAANQWRAVIGSFGHGPKQKPYAWASMQWAVDCALDLKAYAETPKTFKKKTYKNIINLDVTWRKVKNSFDNGDNKSPTIKFHRRYGFDILHGIFSVLEKAGYLDFRGSKVVISEENGNGVPIPESLKNWVGVWEDNFSALKEFDNKAKFYKDYKAAEPHLQLEWPVDARMIDLDDVAFGVYKGPESEPVRKKTVSRAVEPIESDDDDGEESTPKKRGRKPTKKKEDIEADLSKSIPLGEIPEPVSNDDEEYYEDLTDATIGLDEEFEDDILNDD